MGGKRPDQYNIDPREAGATDYKNLPQTGHGRGSQEEEVLRDKQHVAESMADAHVPYNPGKPAPSVHARAGERMEADSAGSGSDEGRERERRGNTDPRDEGVGA
jgi:hypothetical protein